MPEISRFYGIVIRMYGLDHAPPHMHAVYAEHEALIGIGGPSEERADYGAVVLERRLRDAPRAVGRRVGNCLAVGTTREKHDGAIGAA